MNEQITDVDPQKLSDLELSVLASRVASFKFWLASLEAELLRRLTSEDPPKYPTVKAIRSQGNRKWVRPDSETLAMLLPFVNGNEDMIAPRKLISPTQAEKLLGKATYNLKLSEFVERPEGAWRLKYTD